MEAVVLHLLVSNNKCNPKSNNKCNPKSNSSNNNLVDSVLLAVLPLLPTVVDMEISTFTLVHLPKCTLRLEEEAALLSAKFLHVVPKLLSDVHTRFSCC